MQLEWVEAHEMIEREMELLDDLISEFRFPSATVLSDGWFSIGPETQAAILKLWELCDELKPDYQPCKCGVREVVCAGCGVKR